ncbi:hypothetical protein OG799_17085 [Micromonospora sp. NBC_00898]|uniref:hypothetical protein n=1 Tax=Micromonospora sp. NBC_00898 TaxID=2975981 RepID=UPI0038686BBA|nr:hypothetical protein OG799_17085 [Micromonospora sp. NBC_00898]
MLGFLLVNLVLAGALHRYVETPMMRRLGPPRRARVQTPPAIPAQRPSGPDGDAAPRRRSIEYAGRRHPA